MRPLLLLLLLLGTACAPSRRLEPAPLPPAAAPVPVPVAVSEPPPPPPQAPDPERIRAEVRAVVEDFKQALARGDSARVLELLHPDVVIYEGGHAEDLAQYRSHHLGADIAFLRDVTQRTTRDQVIPGDSLALYLSESESTGRARGRQVNARGAETLTLVRTPNGWRIRHIHWSNRNVQPAAAPKR